VRTDKADHPAHCCFSWKQSSPASLVGRSFRTTSESAVRSHAEACFALAEQASEHAGPARLVLVPSGRLVGFTRDDRIDAKRGSQASAGAPVRLVSPQQYGFMSTKHLCRIALQSESPKAFARRR